jgi:MFS family permease
MKNPLINRNFTLLMVVQTIEQIGDSLTLMALIAWVMAMHGGHNSTANMTILLFWIGLPIILVSPFSGIVIDRLKRKYLLIASTAVKGCFIFIIFLFLRDPGKMPILYLLVFMKSLATQFFTPTKSAFVPDVVADRDSLVRANSISATAMIITQILTYALAGLLIAEYGPDEILLASSLLYIPATLTIIFINASEKKIERKKLESIGHVMMDLFDGLKFMMREKNVMFMTRRVFCMMIAVIVFYVSLTGGVLENVMRVSGIGIKPITAMGGMFGALGIGLVIGVVFIEKLVKNIDEKTMIRIAFPVVGLLISGLYFFNNYYYLLACAFVGGMGGVAILSLAETAIQKYTPEELRGRTFSSYYIFKNSGPIIASGIAGLLIRFIDEEKVMLLSGLFLVAYGVINLLGKLIKAGQRHF